MSDCLKVSHNIFISLDSAGVVDVLVNNGRQIDAVNLAVAFKLTETYSPVLLLKSYLANAGRVPSPVKSPNSSSTDQVFFPFPSTGLSAFVLTNEVFLANIPYIMKLGV